MMADRYIGLDFGTTNSAIALADNEGSVRLATFTADGIETENFRSIVYFEQHREGLKRTTTSLAGPYAIAKYLDADQKGRLMQSLKSYLASHLLRSTNVFGRQYLLEELLAFVLRSLREHAEEVLGPLGSKAVVGRPVCFAGAETKGDEQWAITRLRAALARAGFEEVTFEYEPVGAAHFYESQLTHDELILVADFGGGTSDFSLIQVGPAMRSRQGRDRVVGTDGVALAGDAFDAKLVRHLVSPLLGQGSHYQSVDKALPVPAWIYGKLERWHHLSFLKSKETMHTLHVILAGSNEPHQIQSLIHLINDDLGFYLHRSVQRVKAELSEREAAVFKFEVPGISISQPVTRRQFESWIAPELHEVSNCVDRLLTRFAVDPADVNRVFLTGGSSFVPAVRQVFEQRFGESKIAAGNEFTSVARGLALRAFHTK